MSAEYILSFSDECWYQENREIIDVEITSLKTYSCKNDNEYSLLGSEPGFGENDWSYDVRFFLDDFNIFIEISTHQDCIEKDLSLLFERNRKETKIQILDEDGEQSGW